MPAGPAPTMASLSLVMGVLSEGRDLGVGAERDEGSAGTIRDGLGEARQRLADGAVGKGLERRDGVAGPRVGEVESRLRCGVVAQLGELGVEDDGIGAGGDALEAVVDA